MGLLSTASAATPGPNYDLMWDHFKTKYGKVYNGITDESTRFQIFKGHVDFIHTTNAQNLSYRLKVNEFADLTTSEFVSQYTGYKPQNVWSGLKHLGTHEYVGEPLADAVDWTTKGAVTRSIPVVTAVSWTTASLSPRRMPCARRTVTVTLQERALARLRVALSDSPREVSRDTRTCPPTASRL